METETLASAAILLSHLSSGYNSRDAINMVRTAKAMPGTVMTGEAEGGSRVLITADQAGTVFITTPLGDGGSSLPHIMPGQGPERPL